MDIPEGTWVRLDPAYVPIRLARSRRIYRELLYLDVLWENGRFLRMVPVDRSKVRAYEPTDEEVALWIEAELSR